MFWNKRISTIEQYLNYIGKIIKRYTDRVDNLYSTITLVLNTNTMLDDRVTALEEKLKEDK